MIAVSEGVGVQRDDCCFSVALVVLLGGYSSSVISR